MANLCKEFEETSNKIQTYMQAISGELENFSMKLKTKRLYDQYLGPQKPTQKPKKMKEIGTSASATDMSFASITAKSFDENERRFTVLGKIPRTQIQIGALRPIIKKDESLLKIDDWIIEVNYLKTTEFEKFVDIFPHERTTDNCPKGIVFPNASPSSVYKMFCLGLLNCIYPSPNLKELEHFPKNFQTAIRKFVEKTGVDQIYLQISSTMPEWNEKINQMIFPFHIIKIGSSSGPPTFTESKPQLEETGTVNYQLNSIIDIKNDMIKASKLVNYKVNYDSPRILIYSLFKKKATDADTKVLKNWVNKITKIEDNYSEDLKNTFLELTNPYGEEEDSLMDIEEINEEKKDQSSM